MVHYILKRLGLLIIVVFGVTIATFVLMNMAPGDQAEMVAMARYGLENLTAGEIENIRISEGLDAPVWVQYFHWLSHVSQGDFGYSLVTGGPVSQEIIARIPATLLLSITSLGFSLVIAIPAGVVSAVKHNSFVDHAARIGAMLGASIPNFWLALLLILLFSVTWGWFPVFGYGTASHIVLPAVTLGAGVAAITTRLIRASMLEVLKQDYIFSARAHGIGEKSVIFRHALKNAFIPVITVIGMQLGHLLEGTVIVESIFAWPGLGKLLVDSIYARDYAVIQACVLMFAVFFVLINLLVDLLYIILDPRIRYGRGAG
ncbi:MAG: ABC transporter permease [Peptococcaceae bacterium]|nr:ABC transporter permease [Peptococcaceae bacterium]